MTQAVEGDHMIAGDRQFAVTVIQQAATQQP
jgi:hypothetical protein